MTPRPGSREAVFNEGSQSRLPGRSGQSKDGNKGIREDGVGGIGDGPRLDINFAPHEVQLDPRQTKLSGSIQLNVRRGADVDDGSLPHPTHRARWSGRNAHRRAEEPLDARCDAWVIF